MQTIALVHPEIAPNTGNIARLCVCNDLALHLVHPLGFRIDDRNLKRAGMDYWKHLQLTEHANLDAFLPCVRAAPGAWFFSTKAELELWDAPIQPQDWLVFGAESRGLPERVHAEFPERLVRIPMRGEFVRSLNLSSSVAIAAYDSMRRAHSFVSLGKP